MAVVANSSMSSGESWAESLLFLPMGGLAFKYGTICCMPVKMVMGRAGDPWPRAKTPNTLSYFCRFHKKLYRDLFHSIISSKWNPVPYLKDYQISSFSELFLVQSSFRDLLLHSQEPNGSCTIIIWFNQQQQINLAIRCLIRSYTTPTFSGDWRLETISPVCSLIYPCPFYLLSYQRRRVSKEVFWRVFGFVRSRLFRRRC